MKKLKFKKIKILNTEKFLNERLDNKCINLIDIKYNQKNAFENISSKSNKYIQNCLEVSFDILKKLKLKG